MRRKVLWSFLAILALLVASLLGGCGSGKKGGTSDPIVGASRIDNTNCTNACHAASVDPESGTPIVANWNTSKHMSASVDCQTCHGGGSLHQGLGPIPIPHPDQEQCMGCHDSDGLATNFKESKHYNAATENGRQVCNRCHTHQGAVLGALSGFTGDGDALEGDLLSKAPAAIDAASAEPIKCNTCHMSHKPETLLVDSSWTPSSVVTATAPGDNLGSNQYKLCTQCHTYINRDGQLTGSGLTDTTISGYTPLVPGTVKAGHHESSWYRVIATTHYDNPATATIEGYDVRTTSDTSCFDCHGHTMGNAGTTPVAPTATVYTDWAQSAHAGEILTKKYAAAGLYTPTSRTDPAGLKQTDNVMAASVDAGPWGGHNTGSCARCHSTEGFAYYFDNKAPIPSPGARKGVLKCYGCHTDAGKGTIRPLKGTKTSPNYTTDAGWTPTDYVPAYGKNAFFPDVAASNICISCHDGRNADPAGVTTTPLSVHSPGSGIHYVASAAVMYVKMGYLGFWDATNDSNGTMQQSLKADLDGGTIGSTHRKLGTPAINGDNHNTAFFVSGNLDSNGPCVTCHMTGSHSLKMDQKAIDSVCSKCHTSESGHSIATQSDFEKYFLEPQSESFQNALKLAVDTFNSMQSTITVTDTNGDGVYRNFYETVNMTTKATASDWATAATALSTATGNVYEPTKLVGAISNITFLSEDKGAFAHARTYSRRLLYDSIDYLDNGLMDNSVSATALTRSGTTGSLVEGLYGMDATAYTDGSLTTLAPATTESMVFLLGWDRSTGYWATDSRLAKPKTSLRP